MSFTACSLGMLKRIALTIFITALMVFALLVFASESKGPPHSTPGLSQPTAVANGADVYRRSIAMETEVVTVTRRGFEPSAITRSEGKFILMIENPRWQSLALRLSRVTGEPVNQIRASRNEPEWNGIQDLQPGRYLLTEENHVDWKCLITITAR